MGERQKGESGTASHWTSWPPMDDGPVLTDEEQIALVTAIRVQQVARIIMRDTEAAEDAAMTAAWSLASIGLLATPWRDTSLTPPGSSEEGSP